MEVTIRSKWNIKTKNEYYHNDVKHAGYIPTFYTI